MDNTIGHLLTRERAVELMRANWQDPVGFHEAVAAHLGIDEDEYASAPAGSSAAEHALTWALTRLRALQSVVDPIPTNRPIPEDAMRDAIDLSRTLDALAERMKDDRIDVARSWFHENGFPTKLART